MNTSAAESACAAKIGEATIVEPQAVVGFKYRPDSKEAVIGRHGIIRMGTIIYGDVEAGDYLQTGHYTVIRAKVTLGDYCAIGNHSTIEGLVKIGTGTRIMSHVYVPSRTVIGSHVFIGPGCTFLNDKTPGHYSEAGEGGAIPEPKGAWVEDDVCIGGGCIILGGVRIGRRSFIAAGALVTKDVPDDSLVMGAPGRASELPARLRGGNDRRLTIQPYDLWHPLGR